MKTCPFLKKECLKESCQVWSEGNNNCSVTQTPYSVNMLAEIVSTLRTEVKEIKGTVQTIANRD